MAAGDALVLMPVGDAAVVKSVAGHAKAAGRAGEGCSAVSAIELPAGLTSVGYNAFVGCTSLSAIELPAGLTVDALKEGEDVDLSAYLLTVPQAQVVAQALATNEDLQNVKFRLHGFN